MTRPVLVQLVAFVLVGIFATLFGVRYVLGPQSLGGAVELTATLADARSIGPGTSVTYRGVAVGTVESVTINSGGVVSTAELALDPGTQIPVGSVGRVSTATAIGILALDIEPETADGPYLRSGDTLRVPEEMQGMRLDELLLHMTELVESIDADSIVSLGDTWGTALRDTGPELQALLENADSLSAMVAERAPTIATLLDEGLGLIDSLARNSESFPGSMRAFRDVSDQLVGSRESLVYLLGRSPEALARTEELFAGTKDNFGVLMTNLVMIGEVAGPRAPAASALLDAMPATLADLSGIVKGDRADFSLVGTQGPVCVYDTQRMMVGDESPREPNRSLYCPPGEDLSQRGARVAPRPNDLGLQGQTTPGAVSGPDMADDPLLIPTGVEVLNYWQKLLEGLGN